MIVMMLQWSNILTNYLDGNLQFRKVKWQILFVLDYADKFTAKQFESTITESAERILESYFPKYIFYL